METMSQEQAMSGQPKYRVLVRGTVLPEKSREQVLTELAKLFHSRRATMEKLLQGKTVPLSKVYERAQAEQIRRAIRAAGAECDLQEILPRAGEEAVAGANAVRDSQAETAEAAGVVNAAGDAADAVVGGTREEGASYNADADAGAESARGDEGQRQSHRRGSAEQEGAGEKARARRKWWLTPMWRRASSPTAAMLLFIETNAGYYADEFPKFIVLERLMDTPRHDYERRWMWTLAYVTLFFGRLRMMLSWHWPAFFAFFFWAIYRKMWHWAGVHLCGSLALVLLVSPGWLHLLWAVFWPLIANYLYFRHVCSYVGTKWLVPRRERGEEWKAGYPLEPYDEAELAEVEGKGGGEDGAAGAQGNAYKREKPRGLNLLWSAVLHEFSGWFGGVCQTGVYLSIVVFLTFVTTFNEPLNNRMVKQYATRITNILPPGSLQRGDGSVVEGLSGLGAEEMTTAVSLTLLAATAQQLLTREIEDGRESDARVRLDEFEQGMVKRKDAWGTAFSVRREPGQVAVISAGPDGQFGNADDILQYIRVSGL